MQYTIDIRERRVSQAILYAAGGVLVDFSYGNLSSDGKSFEEVGVLQLRVSEVSNIKPSVRRLVGTDQFRRKVVVTYYLKYATAYVEMPG